MITVRELENTKLLCGENERNQCKATEKQKKRKKKLINSQPRLSALTSQLFKYFNIVYC